MLLRKLLLAIAKRESEKVKREKEEAKTRPRHWRPEKHERPAAFNVLEHEPPGYAGTVSPHAPMARGKTLDAIYEAGGGSDDELIAAFQRLPISEQMAAIEREFVGLKDNEKRSIIDALKFGLSAKWIPVPGPQSEVLATEAYITLFGGAGGGGKSEALLGLALTRHKRSLIMRRQFADLDFLTERAVHINGTRNGYSATPRPKLRATDGRLVEFGAAQHPGDEEKYQGQPHDFLGIDEAAQFLESQIRFLMGWMRTTDKKQRTRIVLASNPPLSDEGQWLVTMFRPWLDPHHPNPAKPGELRWFITDEEGKDREVDGPGPHKVGARDVTALSRTFIPAKLIDNPYLSRTDYAAKLDAMPEPLRSAVRDGNFMAVRGDDAFQVIPSEWIRLAQARWEPGPPAKRDMTCISVDPAGGGADAATIAARHGNWYAPVVSERGPQTADGRYIGARTLMERKNNCQIVVDVGGGYGGEVVSTLKDNEAPVIGYRGSDASTGEALGNGLKFANMRAETWWRFREALDPKIGEGIALPPDQELAADLATPRISARALQTRGVILVESKEEIRERLGRSPDKGDAVVVCRQFGGLLEMKRKETPRFPTHANVGHQAAKRYAGGRF